MERYSIINEKDKREIVLLKSFPCKWGKCSFCDYIEDNTTSLDEMVVLNKDVLKNVTGIYKKLEVINSGSVFELPDETLKDIRNLSIKNNINTLVFEVFYGYKNKLNEIREFFKGINVEFKTGIETFDEDFRLNTLNKNIRFKDEYEVNKYFDVICLLVGIKGQTKEMIKSDIEKSKIFDRVCINIFVNNNTNIKRDEDLINWFSKEYKDLENLKQYDIMWNNTDFGVGS